MADAVVLLARILPAVTSFPLVRFLQHFLLSFPCLLSTLTVIVLAVLTLADILIAGLSTSEAHTVHLLALTFGASTLLL